MRPGAERRDWTAEEVRFLMESAGRMPRREICRRLRRSAKSVERMADRLRAQGHAISLRCWEPTLSTCPSCGRRSATARESGVCRPCVLARRLAAEEGRIADLMARLPADARAAYARAESDRGDRTSDPMPLPPAYDREPTNYERDRDAEAYDRALEEWEARRLNRRLRATQRRRERIERRLHAL